MMNSKVNRVTKVTVNGEIDSIVVDVNLDEENKNFLLHAAREVSIIKGYSPDKIDELLTKLKKLTFEELVVEFDKEFGDVTEIHNELK